MSMSAVIGSLRVNLGVDTAAFGAGMAQASSTMGAFGRRMAIGMAAVGATIATGLSVAVSQTIDAADDMSKASKKIGIPIEELSRLKYAADLSGVSFEGLQTSVGALSRKMAEAADGSKGAVEAFEKVGVAVTDANGDLRPTSDVLDDLANAFAGMPDDGQKTALAMELMGKSGRDMIPLLNDGAKALGDLKAEAGTFGQVFTAEMGANAEQFNDNMDRLKGVFGNIAADVAEKLLPYLARFTDWLTENGWRFSNVAAGFAGLAEKLVPVGRAIADGIQIGGDAIVALIGEIGKAAQAIADFWPVVVQAKDAVVAFGTEALDWIKGKIEDVVSSFANLRERMVEIGGNLLQGLWDGMMAKWEGLKESIGSIATGITDTFKGWLGIESPSTVFHEIGVNLMQGLGNGIMATGGVVTGALEGMSVGAQNAMQGLLGAGEQVAQGMGQVNNKMLKASQAFGAAQALVNTYIAASQTLADPTLGFWAKLGAVAKVIATGLGFVAAIKGSGGGGRSGGGGGSFSSSQRVATPAAGATAEKAKPPLDVNLQSVDPNAFFQGKALQNLFTSLQREAGDRGLRFTLT